MWCVRLPRAAIGLDAAVCGARGQAVRAPQQLGPIFRGSHSLSAGPLVGVFRPMRRRCSGSDIAPPRLDRWSLPRGFQRAVGRRKRGGHDARLGAAKRMTETMILMQAAGAAGVAALQALAGARSGLDSCKQPRRA